MESAQGYQGIETINELGAFFDIYRETFLPDLFLFFTQTPNTGGAKTFVAFLRIFEGATITVPSSEAMDNLRRDVEVYRALVAAPTGEGRAAATRNLAALYGITAADIKRIFADMRERARRGATK